MTQQIQSTDELQRPWLHRAWDKKGREIMPGDLIKTDHFIGARRKRCYLYHTCVLTHVNGNGYLRLIPTSHLEPTYKDKGGACDIRAVNTDAECEIIHGFGYSDNTHHILDDCYEDRPKKILTEKKHAI